MQLTIKVNNFVHFAHIRLYVVSFSAKKTEKKNFLFFTSFFFRIFFAVPSGPFHYKEDENVLLTLPSNLRAIVNYIGLNGRK